jgi:hypothetical protein
MKLSGAIAKATNALLTDQTVRRATLFVSPQLTVVATRRHKADRRSRRTEILLTVGTPNHRNREFVKAATKVGEPFPVKKLQLQFQRRADGEQRDRTRPTSPR